MQKHEGRTVPPLFEYDQDGTLSKMRGVSLPAGAMHGQLSALYEAEVAAPFNAAAIVEGAYGHAARARGTSEGGERGKE